MNGPTEFKGHELFRSLSMEAVHRINQLSEIKEFKAGDTIFHQNQEANNLYILLEGLVALRFPATEEAFSVSVIKIEKNDLIGAGALLGSLKYITQAYCVKDSKIFSINAKKFRQILEEDGINSFAVMVKIAHVYFERYIYLMQKIQSIFL